MNFMMEPSRSSIRREDCSFNVMNRLSSLLIISLLSYTEEARNSCRDMSGAGSKYAPARGDAAYLGGGDLGLLLGDLSRTLLIYIVFAMIAFFLTVYGDRTVLSLRGDRSLTGDRFLAGDRYGSNGFFLGTALARLGEA